MSIKPKQEFMRLAIKEARKNFKKIDGGPFGACIIRGNRVLSLARNTVLKNDATCHAEINAIRAASKKLKTYNLKNCIIYSTNEPCPMCFSAIHWAGIATIIYGTAIKEAKQVGFNELGISNLKLKKIAGLKTKIFKHFLYKECRVLLVDWDKLGVKALY